MGHDKQRPLLGPFPVIRMDVFLSGLDINSMNRSEILLLDIPLLGGWINDVYFISLQVEERVEVVGGDYARNQA